MCAIAQPFIMNAPTKIATRWFLPQNVIHFLYQRSLALALLTVVNIVGTAVGFVIPTIFVETDDSVSRDKYNSNIRDEFWTLLFA